MYINDLEIRVDTDQVSISFVLIINFEHGIIELHDSPGFTSQFIVPLSLPKRLDTWIVNAKSTRCLALTDM
jgi:hypothetical protein